MERKYLNIGKAYTATDTQKQSLEAAITTIEWHTCPPSESLPFSQGHGLQTMVKEMGVNVDKIGYGVINVQHGCRSLLAIRNNYSSGDVKQATVYGLDNGTELIMLAVDTVN